MCILTEKIKVKVDKYPLSFVFFIFFFLREGSVFIFDKRVYLTKEYICLCFAVLQLGFKHTAAEKQYRDVKRLAVR